MTVTVEKYMMYTPMASMPETLRYIFLLFRAKQDFVLRRLFFIPCFTKLTDPCPNAHIDKINYNFAFTFYFSPPTLSK